MPLQAREAWHKSSEPSEGANTADFSLLDSRTKRECISLVLSPQFAPEALDLGILKWLLWKGEMGPLIKMIFKLCRYNLSVCMSRGNHMETFAFKVLTVSSGLKITGIGHFLLLFTYIDISFIYENMMQLSIEILSHLKVYD